MQVWSSSSSESKPCAKCGKVTSSYKVYEQTNISVRIPLCEREGRTCHEDTDVKQIADISIKLIKREI